MSPYLQNNRCQVALDGNTVGDERNKVYALLMLAVLCAYANSVWGSFQFSDYNVIVNYPVVHSWERWLNNALNGGIRPLLKLSYTLNWLGGPGPFGFHLFNIAVHVINTLLVYELCRKQISGWTDLLGNGLQAVPAFLAALLFALHPIQTEAVTYISGRSASLMATFYLGSVLAFAYGVSSRNCFLKYVVSPFFFVMAIAVKEVALTLPLALLLFGQTEERRSWKQRLTDLSIHWGVLAGALLVILTNRKYLELLLFSSLIRTLYDNVLSQINGIWYLLSRFMLLYAMNIDPDVPAISSLDVVTAVKLGILLLCAGICIRKRGDRPWLLFGLLWFAIALLPSNSVIPRLDVINERHFYLAGVGVFLAAGLEIALLCRRFSIGRKIFPIIAGAVFATLLCFTMLRNNDYRSERALWESTVRFSSHKSRVYNNLGYAYESEGRRLEARTAFAAALKIDPGNKIAQNNMQHIGTYSRECNSPERSHTGGGL